MRRPRDSRRGVALLIVLMLIVLLTVLVYALHRRTLVEAIVADNQMSDLMGHYYGRASVVVAGTLLERDLGKNQIDTPDDGWAKPRTVKGMEGLTVSIIDEERKLNKELCNGVSNANWLGPYDWHCQRVPDIVKLKESTM